MGTEVMRPELCKGLQEKRCDIMPCSELRSQWWYQRKHLLYSHNSVSLLALPYLEMEVGFRVCLIIDTGCWLVNLFIVALAAKLYQS
jgi:hypothetical protein